MPERLSPSLEHTVQEYVSKQRCIPHIQLEVSASLTDLPLKRQRPTLLMHPILPMTTALSTENANVLAMFDTRPHSASGELPQLHCCATTDRGRGVAPGISDRSVEVDVEVVECWPKR